MTTMLAMLALLSPLQEEERSLKVSEVIEWTAREAKRRFVVDDQVTASYGARRISVAADGLDKARAYEIGLALLRTAGLAAVPFEEAAGGMIRIVPVNAASREQLRVYAAAEALPKADEFCILSLALRQMDIRQAHQVLHPLMTPQSIMVVEGSRTLVMSDFASNLRKASSLIRQLDQPRGASAFIVSFALLEGEGGPESLVPEAFKKADLKGITGRNRFEVVREAGVRIDFGADARSNVTLRIDSGPAMFITMVGTAGRAAGLSLERLDVRLDQEGKAVDGRLLETRLELADDGWAIAGTLPGTKEGSVRVLLIRAVPAK